jgi:hypothetical protein
MRAINSIFWIKLNITINIDILYFIVAKEFVFCIQRGTKHVLIIINNLYMGMSMFFF